VHTAIAAALLLLGVAVNAANRNGYTALSPACAVSCGDAATISALTAGLDVSLVGTCHVAADSKHHADVQRSK
jgi:hypothetical protein